MGQTKICRYCGNIIDVDMENCEYCGQYLYKERDNDDIYCAKCKAPVNTDDNFCQKCGAVFNVPEQSYDTPMLHNISGIPYNVIILLKSIALSAAVTVFSTVGKETALTQGIIFFVIAFIVAEIFLYLYFLPSIIAIENNSSNTYSVYVCNLLFGVTVIGWFICLHFALSSKKRT